MACTLAYSTTVMAGSDATINGDGYSWWRIADSDGLGGGGFSVNNYLVRTSGSCVS